MRSRRRCRPAPGRARRRRRHGTRRATSCAHDERSPRRRGRRRPQRGPDSGPRLPRRGAARGPRRGQGGGPQGAAGGPRARSVAAQRPAGLARSSRRSTTGTVRRCCARPTRPRRAGCSRVATTARVGPAARVPADRGRGRDPRAAAPDARERIEAGLRRPTSRCRSSASSRIPSPRSARADDAEDWRCPSRRDRRRGDGDPARPRADIEVAVNSTSRRRGKLVGVAPLRESRSPIRPMRIADLMTPDPIAVREDHRARRRGRDHPHARLPVAAGGGHGRRVGRRGARRRSARRGARAPRHRDPQPGRRRRRDRRAARPTS